MEVNRLGLLIDNREKMGYVIIDNPGHRHFERFPVSYAKIAHLLNIIAPGCGLIEGALIIVDEFKVDDGCDALLDEPRNVIPVGFGPAPKDLRRHHAEFPDGGIEMVGAAVGCVLCWRVCTTMHQERQQDRRDNDTARPGRPGDGRFQNAGVFRG